VKCLNKKRTAILSNAPIREEVASLSSGAYYEQKSHWVDKLSVILDNHGLILDGEPVMLGDEGRSCMDIVEITTVRDTPTVGCVHFTWYRMPSFNWEIICYIS